MDVLLPVCTTNNFFLTKAFYLPCSSMFYIVYLRFFFIYWPCIIIFLRDDCFTVFCDILGTFLVHLKGKHLKWRDCQYYFEHYFTKLLQFLVNQVHHFTVGLCMQSLVEWCHFLTLSRGTAWKKMHKFCSASVAVTQTVVGGPNALRSLEAALISLLDSICGY